MGGEEGYGMRNARETELIEVPWKGATTMAAMFEQSCKKHPQNRFLGTRKTISRELIEAGDGRKFEKLHLGDYEWQTYGQVFDRASNFASGLLNLGHNVDTRVALFAETRAEWQIAFQVAYLWRKLYVINVCVFLIYFYFSGEKLMERVTYILDFRDASDRISPLLLFMLL